MPKISFHTILPALALLLIALPAWGQERSLKNERVSRTAPSFDPTELLRRISYPKVAVHEKLEGEVRIQVQVDDEGKPVNTTIGGSSHPSFGEQVRQAVISTPFRPGMKNGKPTVEWVVIIVRFDLHGTERKPRIAILKKSGGKPIAMRLEAPVALTEKSEVELQMNVERSERPVSSPPPQSMSEGRLGRPSETPQSSTEKYSEQNNSLMDDIMLPRHKPAAEREPAQQSPPPTGFRPSYFASGEVPEYDDAELQARLKYPEEAKAQRVEGTVVVRAFVDEHGGVVKAEIGKSDNALLDDAARAAVLETRFVPVRRDGKPTAVWVEVPIKFRLPK